MVSSFWAVVVVLLMLSSSALADGIELIPSLDSIPLKTLGHNQNEQDAISKAQKAFVMQTGAETTWNNFRSKENHEISQTADKTGKKVENFIDTQTPLDSKTIAIGAAAAYTICVTKSYTQNLGDPLIHGVHQTLTVGQDRFMTGIKYSF